MIEEAVTHCSAHPDVETELRCSRCDKPICPRCLVQTPVGARCRECANLRRPPMYQIPPAYYIRGFGAALLAGGAAGLAWGVLLPSLRFLGFFAFFLAMGLGYLMAEVVGRATNRKRGRWMQAAAVSGILLAYFLRNLVVGLPLIPANDLLGYIIVGLGSIIAIGYLK